MGTVEAARLLGESRLRLLARCAKGELESQYIAGRTVISRESIDRLLAQRDEA